MSLDNLHELQDSATDPNSEFKRQRLAILSLFEGNIQTPYFDDAGIITIGIGFNIDDGMEVNRELVMGEKGMGLSATQQDAINAAWGSATMDEINALPQATPTQTGAKNAVLCAYLNIALGGQSFSMTDPQIKNVFDILVLEHQDAISSLVSTPSLEQIVLTSLHYNGLVGSGLRAALAKSDSNEARAEAWYQICYGHVAGQSEARRYSEAALFGLYGQGQDTMKLEVANAVYRMYTKHNASDEMSGHDEAYPGGMAQAGRWLGNLGFAGDPVGLKASLKSAADFLINKYASGHTISELNIWVADKAGEVLTRDGKPRAEQDNLFIGDDGVDGFGGGGGNDVMVGNKGADTFMGNGGNDTLKGGAGADTYIYASGDGSDTIYDYNGDGFGGDGAGEIKYDDTPLSGGTGGDEEGETKKATKAGTFKSDDGQYKYVWGGSGSNLVINGTITVKNFNNGDLGITLNERKKKNDDYDNAQDIPTAYDPLTLDLNGNGIETVPAATPPLFFDLNASGIKTSSGWIAPSDGLLVMDRNGNGTIDDGSELFGDATPKYDTAGNSTSGRTADGFAALAQEDTNADGIVDNQDANWVNLRVWQDLNQDGISQSDELATLDQKGIVSFNVGRTVHMQTLPNGNQMADLGTFTRTDGSTGDTGIPQGMADINLMVDTWHRTFSDSIPVTPQTANLPDMQGSGLVRDLREAASLQTAAGITLAGKLSQFVQADRTGQLAMLDDLLAAWGNTSGFADMRTRAAANGCSLTVAHLTPVDEKHLTVLEQFNGRSFYKMPWEGASMAQAALQGLVMGYDGNPKHILVGVSWVLQDTLLERAYAALKLDLYQELLSQTRLKPYLDQITARANAVGNGYLDFSGVKDAISQQLSADPVKGIGDLIDLNNYCNDNYSGTMWPGLGAILLHDTLQSLSVTPAIQQLLVVAGLRFGTDGTSGNDMIFADNAGGTIKAFAGNDTLISGKGNDVLIGGTGNDIYSYQRGDGADSIVDSVGSSWSVKDSNTLQLGVGITAADLTVTYDSSTQTVLLDLGNGDNIHTGSPDDLAIQQIHFADGSILTTDALLKQHGMIQNGTDGADTLDGSDSALYGDVLNSGAGNDTLRGAAGNDTLNGGLGDDTLIGGAGNDTYIYNLGDGADTIVDSGLPSYNWWTRQNQNSNNNILKFGAGIDATMLTSRFDSDTQTAVLELPDGGRIDVGTLNDLSIQTLQFADGSSISIDTLFTQQMLEQTGTADADVLTGSDSTAFSDHLLGLGGDDVLNGGAGNDVLDGGMGNDTLNGGAGSDTYVHNLGDGEDTIIDSSNTQYYWQVGDQNTLSFGAGITADMLTARFDSATQSVMLDLGNGDSVQVGNVNSLSIQSLQFADGTVKTLNEFLKQSGLTEDGTDGSDVLIGAATQSYVNHLNGGAGDDSLVGSGGGDILTGGAGDDVLNGGYGTDTYVFNLGDGADTIIDVNSNIILELGTGITPDTILPRLDGVTGEVRLDFGNGDSISVGSYDVSQSYLSLFIGQIKFADGTSTQLSQLLTDFGLTAEGTSTDDTLHGAMSNQSWMYGFDGNDTLIGGQRDDTLDGGAGNDTLDAGYGNDVLTGGLGDDTLSGSEGNDIYVYNLGDGADVIIDSMERGQINTVHLGAGADIQSIEYQGGTWGDLLLHFADGGSLRIAGVAADNAANTCSIQRFELADGSILNTQQLLSQFKVQVEGTDSNWWDPQSGMDSLNGTNLNDYVSGYGGNDTLFGGAGDDVLDGGDGNDTLSGDAGNDTSLGGTGDDTLYGREGDDVLVGGMGNDVLQGGSGNETYLFNLGDGVDRINDTAGSDVLSFGQGIAQADLVFIKAGVDLRIALPNGADVVVIENWFTGNSTVNTVQFDDASTFDLLSIVQNIVEQPVVGTAGNDILVGSIYNDTLEGGHGNDILIGGTGDDVYRFNAGDGIDQIYELSAMTAVKGGDTIEFDTGITADMLKLSLQAVSLEGGQTWWSQAAFPDSNADLMYGDQQRQVLTIQIGNGGDAIQVMSGKGAIEKYRFADGSEYTWQEMFELQGGGVSDSNESAWSYTNWVWNGTAYVPQTTVTSPHRVLDGTGLAATFDGGIGSDTMLGGMQNDTYLFNLGDGQDVIADFGGQDEISFGTGITADDLSWTYDPLSATPFVLHVGTNGDSISILNGEKGAIESFSFDDGSVITFAELLDNQGVLDLQLPTDIGNSYYGQSGNNLIVGTDGADRLYDGGDSSFMVGGKGDDEFDVRGQSNTLLLREGDGDDTVYINDYASTATLLFGPDVDPVSLQIELFQSLGNRNGNILHDIRIVYGNFDDSVTIHGAIPGLGENSGGYGGGYGGDYVSAPPRIRLQFADGTAWSYEDLLARAENMIVADPNNSTLLGTTGNETYVIGDQAVEYTIVDAADTGNTNTAELGWDYSNGISMGPLADRVTLEDEPFPAVVSATKTNPCTLSSVGGSLVVQFDNGVTLNIDGFDPNDPLGSCAIRDFKFANGTVLDIAQVLSASIETTGTDAADVLVGTAVNDIIDGMSGDDTITGGKGNDVLRGGTGNDTYIFNRGDGADTIEDAAFYWGQQQLVIENNVLQLGAGIDPSAVTVTFDVTKNKIYLDCGPSTGSGQFRESICVGQPGNFSVQTVQFSDGTVWDEWMMTDRMTVGTMADPNPDLSVGITYTATLANGDDLPAWLAFDGATGKFSGTPDNEDVGTLDVSVTATDLNGNNTTSNFALDVLNVNDAPTVSMALVDQSGLQDAPFSFAVPDGTFDDVDFIHGDILTYGATLADGSDLPSWLTFNTTTQTFGGTPANDDVGELNVVVTATDIGGLSASSTFALKVANVNDAPTANADTGNTTDGGGAVQLNAADLLANDTDPDFIHGDVLNIVGVTQAASGAAVSSLNGAVQFDIGTLYQSLAHGQTATDTFTYTASDTSGATSTATVTMTINGVNDAPVTTGDSASVQEDAALTASGNVLTNDSDVDQGSVLNVANAGTLQGNYGSLVLEADGSYNYVLDNTSRAVQGLMAGQVVTEAFAYQATDGRVSTPSVLTVTITGANDDPVAQDDNISVLADGQFVVDAEVLLVNDTDKDIGDSKTLVGVDTVSALGAMASLANGQIVYNHGGRFTGLMAGQTVTDSFTYTMTDSAGATSTATVNATVTGVNDGPIAHGDSGSVGEDTAQTTLDAAGLLSNDTDPDNGDVLSIAGFDAVSSQGNAISLDAAGNLVFDIGNRYQYLAQGQIATDTFNYVVTDLAGATSTAQVTMTITGTNDAPVTTVDTASVQKNLTLAASGNVLTNDTDIDQGTVLGVANAGVFTGTYGQLTLQANGNYTYALNNASAAVQGLGAGQSVTENFEYQATDGIAGSPSTLIVTITGTDSNAAPVTTVDTATVQEDHCIKACGNVLANDTDSELGTVLSITNADVFTGQYGKLVLNANGSYSYTLNNCSPVVQSLAQGQTVTDTFTHRATDGLLSTPSTLTVTIKGSNDAPVVAADCTSVQEDVVLTASGNVLANDQDIDQGTVLTVANAGTLQGKYGSLVLNANGNYTYALNNGARNVQSLAAGQTVTDSFTYNATDGIATKGSTLAIKIRGSNDAVVLNGTCRNDRLTGTAYDDKLYGNGGNDTYVVDSGCDRVAEYANDGIDTVMSSVSYTLGANVENLTLSGTTSSCGHMSDMAINGTGNELNNLLAGNRANNTLNGGGGNDILLGGAGNDTLIDTASPCRGQVSGNNLLDGGADTDTLTGSSGSELFIGGTGNDIINTGNGTDIIVFNRGDGQGTINGVAGTGNTISLGGNFALADLALQKSGNDLMLDVGATDAIALKNWYAGKKDIVTLQVIETAMSDFNHGASDIMRNSNVETFNFRQMINAFDQARAANPRITMWGMTDALLNAHLTSSDTAALGGDLACVYGSQGSLTSMSVAAAQSILSNSQFATAPQTLNPWPTLNTGTAQIR